MNIESQIFRRQRMERAHWRCENQTCPNRNHYTHLNLFWPNHKRGPRVIKAEHFYTSHVLCDDCNSLALWRKMGGYPLRLSPTLSRNIIPLKGEQLELSLEEAA